MRAPYQDLNNDFVKSGIIRRFRLQFELAWKLLQKALDYEGRLEIFIGSPRGVIKAAYSTYDFIEEDVWLRMLDDRNAAEHVYDSEMATRLVGDINVEYISVFEKLLADLEKTYPMDVLETF